MIKQERIDQLLNLFHERSPITQTLHMRLAFDDHGRAMVSMPSNPGLYHGLGYIQGGVYAVLMDAAGWFTAAARRDPGMWLATSEMSVHFLAPTREDKLRAEARIIKAGKRQDICEMRLYEGEDHLIGHATATFILLPDVPWD